MPKYKSCKRPCYSWFSHRQKWKKQACLIGPFVRVCGYKNRWGVMMLTFLLTTPWIRSPLTTVCGQEAYFTMEWTWIANVAWPIHVLVFLLFYCSFTFLSSFLLFIMKSGRIFWASAIQKGTVLYLGRCCSAKFQGPVTVAGPHLTALQNLKFIIR